MRKFNKEVDECIDDIVHYLNKGGEFIGVWFCMICLSPFIALVWSLGAICALAKRARK